MTSSPSSKWLYITVFACAAALVASGVYLLEPHEAHEHHHHDHAEHAEEAAFYIQSYVLIGLGLLAAALNKYAVRGLEWLLNKIYRAVSFILMLGVLFSESVLHLLNVPHVEGWWIPILGSSVFATATAAWIYKFRKDKGCCSGHDHEKPAEKSPQTNT